MHALSCSVRIYTWTFPIGKQLRKSLQQHIEFGHHSTSIQNAFALAISTVSPVPFFYSKVAIIL